MHINNRSSDILLGGKLPDNVLLIPVHPPKTDLLFGLLNSIAAFLLLKKHDLIIVLITSNSTDAKYFNSILLEHPIYQFIHILDAQSYAATQMLSRTIADRLDETAAQGVINVKKFIGLYWMLRNKLRSAACVDCDSIAIAPPKIMFDQLKANYDTRIYVGTQIDMEEHADLYRNINERTSRLFGKEDKEKIKGITDHFNIYTWFFDVPFYLKADVEGLFSYMKDVHGSEENFIRQLNFFTFDHLIYIFYRIISGNARLYNVSDKLGIPSITERMSYFDALKIFENTGYFTTWLSPKFALEEPKCFSNKTPISMIMHMDRSG